MTKPRNRIEDFMLSISAPVTVSVAFVIFTFFYWGPSIFSIGLFFSMLLIVGPGSLILLLFVRKRHVITRTVVTGSFAFIVGFLLQIMQFQSSTPNKLMNAFLTDDMENELTADKGRLYFIGFEHEIYLKLESNPASTKNLLKSRDFKLMPNSGYNSYDGPRWFPNKYDSKYTCYEYSNLSTEELYLVLVSRDSSEVYGFYLAY